MAAFTKRAILFSFLKLCEKKSPDKITVKDIVDDCEINRNTFYYYFQDIYALLEELFYIEASKIFSDGDDFDSIMNGILESANSALHYRKAVLNIYVSLGRDRFEEYLSDATADLWSKMITRLSDGEYNDPEAVKFVSDFYRHAFCGVLCDWFKSGMKDEPEFLLRRISLTFRGSVKAALRNYCIHKSEIER